MHYLKRKREKRVTERVTDEAPKKRGFAMTMISLVMVGAIIALIRSRNPEMDMKPMLMMFGGVVFVCLVMNFISNRKKRDDE